MANPVYVELSSIGTKGVNVDYCKGSPFDLSVLVSGSSSGTFGYSCEFSLDSEQVLSNIGSTRTPLWMPITDLTAASCNKIANITFPIAQVRLTSSALSSATLTMTVLQSGV